MSEPQAPYRTKAKKAQPEQELQKAVVTYIRAQYPNVLFWHTPNGGHRSAIEASIFKGLGVVAGVPDLFIARANKSCYGLFLELKAKGGKLSDKQREMCERLHAEGYAVAVVDDFDDAIGMVKIYLRDHLIRGRYGF